MHSSIAEYPSVSAASAHLQKHLRTFTPFAITAVSEDENASNITTQSPFCDISTYLAADVKDCPVQVAIAEKGESFSGDPLRAWTVEMRLEEFVRNYEESGARSNLSLFLSQCPIFSNEPEVPALLPQLQHLIHLPEALVQPADILRVNLWISTDATSTTTHYDANHNFLHVHKGMKKVTLIPPLLAHKINPHPAWKASVNHASISMQELRELKASPEGREHIQEAVITDGGLLFIPEGWWHQVDSTPGTIALNYWFKSPLYDLFTNPTVAPYLLRGAVHRSVDHRIEEQLRSAQHEQVGGIQVAKGSVSWLRAVTAGRSVESLKDMAQILLRFAAQQPSSWTRLLLVEADPYTIELLTSAWEAAQMHRVIGDEFYTAMFDACGDQVDEARVRLVEQKDRYRQIMAQQTLEHECGINLRIGDS